MIETLRKLPIVLLTLLLAAFYPGRCTVSLQQTAPVGGAAVCPLDTAVFTCVTTVETNLLDLASSAAVVYQCTNTTMVNDTGTTGIFRTMLTAKNGITLTSTATVDSVQLEYAGRRIRCRDNMGAANEQVGVLTVAGVPPPPSNLSVSVLNITNTELSVNLSWSLDHPCVVFYLVEVTNLDTNDAMNFNITADSIALTLETNAAYSFRVRGADRAGRGEWSPPFNFSTSNNTNTLTPSSTPSPTTTPSVQGLPPGAIAGIVIGVVGGVVVVIIIAITIIIILLFGEQGSRPRKVHLESETELSPVSDSKVSSSAQPPGEGSSSRGGEDPEESQKPSPEVPPKKQPTDKGGSPKSGEKPKDQQQEQQLNYAEVEASGGGGIFSKITGVFYSTVDHDRTAAGSQDERGTGTDTV